MSHCARRSLWRPYPAKAVPGLQMRVGSFAKSTGAAPVTQSITFGSKRRLRFVPKAVILWTSGGSADGTIQTQATLDARACLGIMSGTAAADQFASSTTADTAGGGGRRQTQKALLLTDAAGSTVKSEASLASFDLDGFTLTWSTNATGESQIVHYLAIGGDEVSAKVLHVTSPAGTGNFATTGAGFQPNLLFSIGSGVAGALDTGFTNVGLRCGAATGPAARWAAAIASSQNTSSAGWRWHLNTRFVEQSSVSGTIQADMDHVSMDSDGFTLNQISALSGSVKMGILCLKVPNVAVGTFTKPTGAAPATGTVSGLSFQPVGLLLASDQDINRSNVASQTGARLGLSALTKDGAAASSVFSVPHAPNPLTFAYLEKSSKAAVKIDNATPAIDAECTAVFNVDGFSLTWNANDAVATEYGYLALGA